LERDLIISTAHCDIRLPLSKTASSQDRRLGEEIRRKVFAAIKQLIAPPSPARKRIGFHPDK